jgi:hypothetical protein
MRRGTDRNHRGTYRAIPQNAPLPPYISFPFRMGPDDVQHLRIPAVRTGTKWRVGLDCTKGFPPGDTEIVY